MGIALTCAANVAASDVGSSGGLRGIAVLIASLLALHQV
jgi:hypothetical protein